MLLAAPGFGLAAQAKDWPAPIKAIEAQGVEVIGTFEAPGGLTGYAGQKSLEKLVSKPMTERVWTQLEQSTWIGDGKSNAPRTVYTFTDPNCPFCNKFWNDARPWIASGKVQLRYVMVAILGATSPGKAAALLAAKDRKRR